MSKQIFGYTPPKADTGRMIGFIQLHQPDPMYTLYDFVVREHNQPETAADRRSGCPINLDGLRHLQHQISVEIAREDGSAAAEIHSAPVEMDLPPQDKLRQLRLVSDGIKTQLLTPDGRDLMPDLMASKLTLTFDPGDMNTLTIETKFVQIQAGLPIKE